MTAITSAMVGQLRDKTDASLETCRNALHQASGNIAAAEDLIRFHRVKAPTYSQGERDLLLDLEQRVVALERELQLLREAK